MNELDDFIWSYSRLNCYETCPMMFYLKYIVGHTDESNFFAEWGTFTHGLLEKYYNKELDAFDLSFEYIDKYDENVTHAAPRNKYVDIGEKYYQNGISVFDNFTDVFAEYEILGTEQEFHIDIGKFKFRGYIDLILRGDSGIIIVDHKSRKKFKNKKEREEYFKQLYLYCLYIKEQYGEYPESMVMNLFKENLQVEEKFSLQKLEETKQWVFDTIQMIYEDGLYFANPNYFFCNNICGVKDNCSWKY